MNSKSFRTACAVLTTTAAALLLPALASAGTGSYGDYNAAPGEVNNVVATGNGAAVTITDSAGAIAGTNCTQINPTTISCVAARIALYLGDQNDSFSYAGGTFQALPSPAVAFGVHGEEGSDTITGSPYIDSLGGGGGEGLDGPDVIRGGDSKDYLHGDDGDDTLFGEGGNDGVNGGGGNDIADGGPGNDDIGKTFHGGGCSGPDTLIGGPGEDIFTVSCGEPTLKFRDGEADEGSCATAVTTAVKQYDKVDNARGGICQTYTRHCLKAKKKKGKSATAAKKKKKKKCWQKKWVPGGDYSFSSPVPGFMQ